jgi:drug/metabolite transporter (DMT)-like permease
MKIANGTGAGLCAVAMAILGSSVAINRSILDYPVLTGQAIRYAVAAVAFGLVLAAVERRVPATHPSRTPAAAVRRHRAPPPRLRGRDLLLLAVLALTGLVLFNVLLLVALRHADAAIVGTVVGAAPLGLALIGPLQRRARPAARLVGAAAVVVAGTALVHGGGHTDRIGMLASFGTLAGEIAFSLLGAAALPRLGALRVSAWSCALAVPMLAAAVVVTGELGRWRAPTATEATTLGYLALVLTVGAFLAWFAGLRRLGIERAGMFTGLLPVATLATAAIQDGRPPNPLQVAGVLVVAAGLAASVTSGDAAGRRPARRPAAAPAPRRPARLARTIST